MTITLYANPNIVRKLEVADLRGPGTMRHVLVSNGDVYSFLDLKPELVHVKCEDEPQLTYVLFGTEAQADGLLVMLTNLVASQGPQ